MRDKDRENERMRERNEKMREGEGGRERREYSTSASSGCYAGPDTADDCR